MCLDGELIFRDFVFLGELGGGWGGRLTFPGPGGVGGPVPQGSCPMWAPLGE